MAKASSIPDRLRKYFPLNGGRRPSARECYEGHRGIEEARSVLAETVPPPPSGGHVITQLSPEQIERARRGIDAARHALDDEPRADRTAE